MYYSVWKQFNEFFIKLDIKPKTWEERLTLFVGYLVEQRKKSTTIKSYISAIKAVLREDCVEIFEDRYLLTSLTKACKYKNDHVRIRLPIQKEMLQILLNQVTTYYGNTQPYLTVLYRAIFASAYYGLLTIGEVASGTHPVRAYDVHVGENKRKIRFYLRTSKTHWTDIKPQEISFSSTSKFEAQVNCPYRILREYMNQCPQRCINTQSHSLFFQIEHQ